MNRDEVASLLKEIKDEKLRAKLLNAMIDDENERSWILREAREFGFKPKPTKEYVRWSWGLGYVAEITIGIGFIVVGLFFLFVMLNPIFGICFPLFGAVSVLSGIKRKRMMEKRKGIVHENFRK